ncbi:hypothetical protein [Parabacteroides goldsteinii]|jgi:Chromosome segregation ATPases|uniref:hypothetical protein n=1 Tax=Parabacteroides goldsteinii TaxID=328812 RepID=UPI000E8F3233|nr:hypothetical protein [Parabacteroides goldsteinii]DAP48876.1 MAG TPA: Tape measure domain protein [Caudoviricetes sp.]HBA31187.1 hypothetical protein [Parabacteroides goldsteinii]
MEPIKLEFIVKGDIEKELAKVKLAIKGVGDESYTSFTRLLSSSNDAFNSMSKDAQRHALILQRYIQKLRQNEAAQEALYDKFKKGTVSSEEYAQAQSRLAVQQAELKQRASELSRTVEREIQLNKAVKGSIDEKRVALNLLREEYSRLNKEERENEKIGGQLLSRIRELDRETKSLNSGLKEVKASSSDLTDTLEQIPGPIGDGVSQFKQLLSAGKAFMSSGIGIFVAGLTALFYGLKTAIEGSEQATTKMNATFVYAKSIWDTQKKMLTEATATLYNLFTGDWEAANKSSQRFIQLQMNQVGYAKASALASEEQVKINKQIERNNGLILANSAAIEQYRTQLMDVNKTFEERKKIGQEVLKLEKENVNLRMEPLARDYNNFIFKEQDAFQLISDQFKDQTVLANKYFNTLAEGGELTLGQQHDLINAVNDITSGLDRVWDDEQKAKFRSYFSDALTVTKDYYSKTREVSTNLSNIIKQQANEAAKANKKTALQKLQEEVKLYKEQYAILYAYERNMGKEAADEAFKDLKTKGTDFIAYLSNKINELQNKPNRTKADDINLGYLQKTRQEAAPKFDASAFKHSIEEKKKLYKKDIDAYIEYLDKLHKLMDQDTSTVGTQKRIILDLEIKDQKEERQKQIDDTLKQYAGYTTQMTSLHTTYQRDMSRLNALLTKATTDEERKRIQETIKLREDGYKQSLLQLGVENEDFYNVLFGGLQEVSVKTLRKALEDAEKWIKEFEAKTKVDPNSKTGIDLANIKTQIHSIKTDVDKVGFVSAKAPMDFSKGVGTWATQFQDAAAKTLENLEQIADVAHYIDEDFGNAMDTVVGIVGGVSDIAEGVMSVFKGDIVSAVNKSITGTYKIFKTLADNVKYNRQVRRDYEEGLLTTYDKELEYNSILRERLRVQQQIGETSLQYFTRLQEELKKQKVSANDEYNEVWSKLMGEEYISKTNYKHGTWFRKAKTWNDYESLSGKTYEEIEKLYTQDKLEGAAKTLFERLKQLKEEGADVVDMMDDLKTEMNEAWTGTTSSAISDSIMQGFLNGKKSAIDYADDFEDLMRNAMMKSIQMKYLEAPLQKWYEKFAQDSETGLTSDKIAELRKAYDQIIESAAKEAENLEKITGIGMATGEAGRTAVAKGITSVSQDSFDEYRGSVNALQYITANIDKNVTDIQVQLYKAAEKWIQIEENTRYCRKLEGIEKDIRTVSNGIQDIRDNGIILRK